MIFSSRFSGHLLDLQDDCGGIFILPLDVIHRLS